MRFDVKKFLFIGDEDEKEHFFKRAQEAGIVHFINTSATTSKSVPEDVQRIITAIKILRGLPIVEQEENVELIKLDSIVDSILHLNRTNEELLEELRVLQLEIARVEIFGDFSLDDIAYIEREAKRKIQFFCTKEGFFRDVPEPEELIYVGSDYGLDYYVAINPTHTSYDKMIEIKIDHSLGTLRQRYLDAQKEHRHIEQQLKVYAKYNDFLHTALIAKLNQYHLYTAQSYVQHTLGGSLFAVEGWVPENKAQELEELVEPMRIHCEEVAIEPKDSIPTYLENHGLGRLGEDLVGIYDTPSASDKDPSLWVLFCFTLFFAFIIGDAGYGLIYLGIALFLRYKYPNLKGMGKRVLNLFTLLCVGCIIWGTLTTSFFGMQIDPDNPLRKVSLTQWLAEKHAAYDIAHHNEAYQEWIKKYPDLAGVTDPHQFVTYTPTPKSGPVILNGLIDNIMFELALFLGVVHLIISFLRYSMRHWQNLGWAVFLLGAYLYFPYYLNIPSTLNFVLGINLAQGGQIGLQLMIGGFLFAWIASIIIHGLTGIFEFTTVIQVFADTLSYLRLYALGLAGAIVATTINEVAGSVPLIIGIILILISHAINIVLSTMSGIIHGLRLNFLEWYHYSFEGGGKEFQPLKLLKRE